MELWDVKRDEDRAQWTFTPLVSVGPLQFGMSPYEVAVTLGRDDPRFYKDHFGGDYAPREDRFTDVGVVAYHTGSGRLAGVAVDALNGPQVTLEGIPLVGRVPSTMEHWICDHTQAHGLDLLYIHEGNPGSADLGLIMRVQRAGDILLSRPLFLIREWAMGVWDHVPQSEWRTV
ncbi:MAG: hypothetical protein JWN00_2348 [Actinomycetia bacterium]|nr:hypothetical protein [Actinomycetes bacterium]